MLDWHSLEIKISLSLLQCLKCFIMTSGIDITSHVCTFTCVSHIVDTHLQLNQLLLHLW